MKSVSPRTSNKDNNRHDLTQHQGFTYPGDEWKRGGGSPWAWYSYDPELKLIYESNGNPGNWSPTTRCGENPPTQEGCNSGKWDNKWSMTIFARHVEDGSVAWNYQMTAFRPVGLRRRQRKHHRRLPQH